MLLLPVALFADSSSSATSYDSDDYEIGYQDAQAQIQGQGLSFNGQALENVYAYDAKGRPLRDVQLFDVDGNPLVTNRFGEDSPVVPLPATLETGAQVFNVYPLAVTFMTTMDEEGNPVPDPSPDPDKERAFRDGPFVKVPAVDRSATGEPMEKVSPNNE